jgi:hypothetical protein
LCFLPSPDGFSVAAAFCLRNAPGAMSTTRWKAQLVPPSATLGELPGQDLSVVGTARKTGYACRRVRKLSARIF